MCGRSSLTKTEKELEQRFLSTFYSEELEQYNPLPNYNIAPSHVMPIITNLDKDHFKAMRWGLIPSWAKDMKIGYNMINARKETLLEKRSFKSAVEKRRCLVPADGFYEWQKSNNGKQAFHISLIGQKLFAMAGLWDKWSSPDGNEVYSYTVITQEPNDIMTDIHDRMPAILTPEQEALWLSDDLPPQQLLNAITPYDSNKMIAKKVSDRVNNVRNNDKGLLDDDIETQLSLF
ncbi:SOS response-associated peptidase [Saprospiraceae bacterium]|nr:SOS response-associated peptidase [Saprospiraceae bacterium]